MFPASTKGGGMCMAFPDVCKIPATPSPIPTPFPNMAQCTDADGDSCSNKVKISNKATIHVNSNITQTHGDEAGSLKGVVSGTTGDKAVFKAGSSKVQVEGNDLVMHLKTTAHNGSSSSNAPQGVQLTPSQMKVLIG